MIVDLFRALQAGKELANAETWKKTQLWTAKTKLTGWTPQAARPVERIVRFVFGDTKST